MLSVFGAYLLCKIVMNVTRDWVSSMAAWRLSSLVTANMIKAIQTFTMFVYRMSFFYFSISPHCLPYVVVDHCLWPPPATLPCASYKGHGVINSFISPYSEELYLFYQQEKLVWATRTYSPTSFLPFNTASYCGCCLGLQAKPEALVTRCWTQVSAVMNECFMYFTF